MRRVLVAARTDRGGARVSDEELREVRQEFGFEHYVSTSAKDGLGIDTLLGQINALIDWNSLTKVSSTRLFDSIRGFLLAKRDTDALLSREDELREAFAATGAKVASDLAEEFRACVDRAEARGLVKRLSFGGFVLLRPEVLDAYAAAVVNAAATQSDGLGAIRERIILAGDFSIPTDVRIADKSTEQLLLIATVEGLLHHEIALREDSEDGAFLVFPTESRRTIDVGDELTPWCVLDYDGPVEHVWATLIVRLSHSGVFTAEAVAGNAARFGAAGRAMLIVRLVADEGQGKLQLYTDGDEASGVERLLEKFVLSHLEKRAVRGTVRRSDVLSCRWCRFVMPEAIVTALANEPTLHCAKCGKEVQRAPVLPDKRRQTTEADGVKDRMRVRALDAAANDERSRLTRRMSVEGKAAVHDRDVFMAHNSLDKRVVAQLADKLRDAGLNPWVDEEEIPPGGWFQHYIQEAIGRVRSAAVIIGASGLGPWQAVEVRAFMSRCVNAGLPLIPVLLPGATWPEEVPFISELNAVIFEESVEETGPFARLVWGITQDKDRRDALMLATAIPGLESNSPGVAETD